MKKDLNRPKLHSTKMRMPLKMAAKLRAEKDKKIAFRRVAKHKVDLENHSTNHHEPKAELEQVQNYVCQPVKKGSENGDGAQQTSYEDEQNIMKISCTKEDVVQTRTRMQRGPHQAAKYKRCSSFKIS